MTTVRLRSILLRPEVLLIGFAGLLLRCWVLLTPSGILLSDEAVTGLSALDIAHGHPGILIPESYYTALTESYLFAPFARIFGAHVVPLKLMGVVLWGVAAVIGAALAMRLARRPIPPTSAGDDPVGTVDGAADVAAERAVRRAAITVFSLLWLVPGAMMIVSTRAYLGYAGGVAVVMASLLALVRIAQDGLTPKRAAQAGFLIGLAFMMHPIYIGGLAPAALVLTWPHRRAWRTWHLPAALGFVVGCGPWLWWNLLHHWASLHERDTDSSTYSQRVRAFFSGLFPRDLGLRDTAGNWVIGRTLGLFAFGVVLFVLLWAVVRLLRSGLPGRIVAVPAALGWLTLGVFGHTSYVADGRYGVMPFPISIVVLGAALGTWSGNRSVAVPVARRGWIVPALFVAAWVGVLVLPYQVKVVGTKLGDPNSFPASVVQALDTRGITKLSGEYFDVLQVSYLSDGRIATRVFYPLPIRYPRMQQAVENAPPDEVAVLFQTGGMRPEELRLPLDQYEKLDLPGHELYVPHRAGS